MSQIEQAKREAKRLFKLAKTLSLSNQPTSLPIASLGQAREHIAIINGYPNWYEYETFIKNKNKTLQNIHEYEDYEFESLQKIIFAPIEFLVHKKIVSLIETPQKNSIQTNNIPLKLGIESRINKKIIGDSYKKIMHYVTEFPLVYFGSNASGRTVAALNIIKQWIQRKEGCIILDNGAHQYNLKFVNDSTNNESISVLNFLNNNEPTNFKHDSIDPINPLIGNETIFKLLFGNEIGFVIHEICKVAQQQNILLDYKNIEAMMSLCNLKGWLDNNTWKEASSVINKYLLNNTEENHIQNCLPVQRYLKIIERFTSSGVFSIQPTVCIKNILKNKSKLYCLLPSIHSASFSGYNIQHFNINQYKEADYQKLGDLLVLQINYLSEKLFQEKSTDSHVNNIGMLEFEHICSNKVNNYFFDNLSKCNWLFSGYIPHQESESYQTIEEKNKLNLIDVAKTIVLMRSNTVTSELPDKLKLKILNNVPNFSNIFNHENRILWEQSEGNGYAMVKVNDEYQLIKMKLYYDK